MNLTWHIVKKDFLRLRLALALWVLLMVGQFILGYQILHVVDADATILRLTVKSLDYMQNVLFGLQMALCCLLVATLIQEDPLVGQEVWWVTRPISGARLLGAKLLGLFLFFWVLPVVVTLPWWLYSGLDSRALPGAMVQLVSGQAVLTMLALAIAVLSANAARFVVVILLLIFAWMCFFIILMAHSSQAGTYGGGQTRALAEVVLAVVGIGVVVVHQYLTRRSTRSWIIFSAGFVLILAVAAYWPWDWSNWTAWRRSEPPALAPVTVTPGTVWFTKVGSNEDPSLVRMELGMQYANLPGDYELGSGQFIGTLRWADGLQRTCTGWIGSYMPMSSWRIMGLKAPAGVTPEKWQEVMRDRGDVAMSLIPRSFAAKLRQQAPVWDGRVELSAFRGELVAEVALREGAKGGHSGHHVRIMGIERLENGGLILNTAESFPILASEIFSVLVFPGHFIGPPSRYVLCSQDRTKFVQLQSHAETHTMTKSVMVVRQGFGCDAKQLANPAEPNWLDRAELLKVAYWPEGTLVRSAHSDGLVEKDFRQGKWLKPEILLKQPANEPAALPLAPKS